MNPASADFLPPRIALIDDETQVHASIRLRLGRDFESVSFFDAQAALEAVPGKNFDLCFVDVHLPGMDGLAFIEEAARRDPALGFVVLTAFDTDENLRRAIPLHVYAFISKPLPEPEGFEARIPAWVARTRDRRRNHRLADQASELDRDLHAAQLERDVELVAAASARDALLQVANLLTTVHAHLVTACAALSARTKADPALLPIARNLENGRGTAEAAAAIAGGFFDSAYGSRDTSPALINPGLVNAIGIACRMTHAEEANKLVDYTAVDHHVSIRGLSGLDFLLTMVPVIAAALLATKPGTTVGLRVEALGRLDLVHRDPPRRSFLWANRRHAFSSQPAVAVTVTASGPPLSRTEAEAWLKGDHPFLAIAAPRGLVAGLQKSHGLLGLALAPHSEKFTIVVALPT